MVTISTTRDSVMLNVKNMSSAIGGKGMMIIASIITSNTGAPSPLRLRPPKFRVSVLVAIVICLTFMTSAGARPLEIVIGNINLARSVGDRTPAGTGLQLEDIGENLRDSQVEARRYFMLDFSAVV